MRIIPVIDLKDGQVVSAQQGNRNAYQAVDSTLCDSSVMADVLAGFLAIYPFHIVYIADLNAIMGSGNNQALIDEIIHKNPAIEFWVDNGKKIADLSPQTELPYKPIIGSESQNLINFQATRRQLQNTILSLDFSAKNTYMGPPELLNNARLWPQNIILMTLDRIGSKTGPDLDKLTYFCKKYPQKNLIAAGGIRHLQDLLSLKKIDIHCVLVASALHSGAINTAIIKDLRTKKYPK